MSGVTKNYDKQKAIKDLEQHDLYAQKASLRFDLRGYAAYIKKHGLRPHDITPEILAIFTK